MEFTSSTLLVYCICVVPFQLSFWSDLGTCELVPTMDFDMFVDLFFAVSRFVCPKLSIRMNAHHCEIFYLPREKTRIFSRAREQGYSPVKRAPAPRHCACVPKCSLRQTARLICVANSKRSTLQPPEALRPTGLCKFRSEAKIPMQTRLSHALSNRPPHCDEDALLATIPIKFVPALPWCHGSWR